jgi:hypothetical protein
MIPGLSSAKLIGGLAIALLIAFLVADRGRFMHRAHVAEAQAAADCQAARTASGLKKLKCEETDEQIAFLGEAVTALKNSLHVQNAAVAALGSESERQKAEAAKAAEKAQERAKGAEAVSDRLIASSRQKVPTAGSCEPSKAVQEQWQ